MRRDRFAATAVTGLLAGCGGALVETDGSGGSNCPPGRPDCPVQIAPDGETEIFGDAQAATFIGDLGGSGVILTQAGVPVPATLRIQRENGMVVGLVVDAGGASVSFDTDDAIAQSNDVVALVSDDGSASAVFVLPERVFRYQSFGVWDSAPTTAGGTIGVGSFGIKTAISDVPRSGSASFDGFAIGYAELAGEVRRTSAEVRATTSDFATIAFGTIDTEVTFLDGSGPTAEPALDMTGQLTVTGNGFSGSVSSNATGVDSGAVNGHFFGPDASEIGGTFGLSGNGNSYTGAFGARR